MQRPNRAKPRARADRPDAKDISLRDVLGSLEEVEGKFAPARLYCAGDTGLLHRGPRVSVVGSRRASEEGLRRARLLTHSLVERGIVVVSGLAAGIDTVAHSVTIDKGGSTIAVIGTPLDRCFPAENEALQQRMMRAQLVVSQFAPGSTVTPKNFPIRNRTITLLSDATVIVEASEKSGTVHQGWEALRLGRMLFLLESVANDSNLTWPSKMIHYGALVLTRDNLADALADIPAVTSHRLEELPELA